MDQAPGSPQGPQNQGPSEARELPVCYRHPDRETGIRCTRCERPICPECMVDASVGFQCPECVRTGSGTGHAPAASRPRTLAGGTVTADPRLLTKILIGINVAVFIAGYVRPSLLNDLVLLGAWPPKPFTPTAGVAGGEWYRMVTSMFTHHEIWHIAFNMLSLWWLGGPLEAALGRLRYLAVYFVSGLSGSALAYLLASPTTETLGASGAIFGLFGATAVLMRRLNYDLRPIVALLVINLIFTFSPGMNISWQAHIGGLVAGVISGYAMVHAPRRRRALVQYGVCALVLAAVVVVTLVRTAQLT
ncbi:rhomboid family intramembrane serine protease [Streptomyces sp. Ru72]|uniref:rhomboid family intramembrane serine protease n=1 Tax=Streptomyces sp. Ru72 TaxID=2080747 RepID=UPI000CDDF44B|nr:rhomboid family intramembrane serine protease [Streptomyces sp. Ru72]POX55030.1 rhomboid family intramembrane serine protease [Streptomyces sp. Ru72]